MIKFVYKIFPVLISYTDKDLNGFAGKAYGPYIRIKNHYKKDEGLLQHELVHAKQFYRTFMIHGILYYFISSYRLKSEIEAYQVQLKYTSEDRKDYVAGVFANFVATRYKLKNINIEEVKKLILNKT